MPNFVSDNFAEREERARFSGVSLGARPRKVCAQGPAGAAPEGSDAFQAKFQLRLPSVPMQVVFGRGWRFLRQRRSVVWVWTKPGYSYQFEVHRPV